MDYNAYSFVSFCLSGIPQSSRPQFRVGSQEAYVSDPDTPPLLQSPPFSIRTTAAGFFLSLCVFRRRKLCADISAQIRCAICNSTSYALNCLCHSFLSDLPLFCSLQLPDRFSTITEGVYFSSSAAASFEPLAQRVVFKIQKEGRAFAQPPFSQV